MSLSNKKELALLAGLYTQITLFYKRGKGWNRRGIRRLLRESYTDIPEFSSDTRERLAETHTIDEIVSFLRECARSLDRMHEEERVALQKKLAGLNKRSALALAHFLTNADEHFAWWKDNDLYISLACSDTEYTPLTLVLTNAQPVPDTKAARELSDFWDYGCYEMTRFESPYQLEFSGAHFSDMPSLTLSFSDVKTILAPQPLYLFPNYITPWEALGQLAACICSKDAILPPENEVMRRRAELAEAVRLLFYPYTHTEHLPTKGLGMFCTLANETDAQEVVTFVDRFREAKSARARNRLRRQWMHKLTDCVFEPFWRELTAQLADPAELLPDDSPLTHTGHMHMVRRQVCDTLHAQGYQGDYPHFYKESVSPRLLLVNMLGTDCLLIGEKRLYSLITCEECIDDGSPTIHFLCGTAFLKKDEPPPKDVYACMFRRNGRRTFRMIQAAVPENPSEYGEDLPPITSFTTVAAKRAECKRLNKEERKHTHFLDNTPLSPAASAMLPIGGVIFTGALFGGILLPAMALLGSLILLVFGHAADIGTMLAEIPWGALFLFCILGFGGGVTLFGLLSRK